jgi:hypothetical protein
MISMIFKGLFALVAVVGVALFGGAMWASQDIASRESKMAAMSPAERATFVASEQAQSEHARRERLKGTECEKLTADECFDLRERQHKQQKFVRELLADPDYQRVQQARADAARDAGQ